MDKPSQTVKPALNCAAYPTGMASIGVAHWSVEDSSEWPVTAIDGTAAQIAERVREALRVPMVQSELLSIRAAHEADDEVGIYVVRVLRALGIEVPHG